MLSLDNVPDYTPVTTYSVIIKADRVWVRKAFQADAIAETSLDLKK